jgi:hypothetical protein
MSESCITVIDVVRDIGDDLQVAMVVSDKGKVIYANSAAVTLFGYGHQDDILGTDIRDIAPSLTMGQWDNFMAHPKPGMELPLAANAGKIADGDKTYFMALFRDRSDDIRKEQELQEALQAAEAGLLEQKKLGAQVNLVKRFFDGTMALIGLTAFLTALSWTLKIEAPEDTMAMFERILLVLTGMLGSAMSGIFESKKGKD